MPAGRSTDTAAPSSSTTRGNGAAFAAIYNEGLIQGDGHAPTGVTPADAASFDPAGREGINIIGTFADTITNKGQIIGAVRMGGGDDIFNAYTGSSTSSTLDGGDDNDTLHLYAGIGTGSIGHLVNFEQSTFTVATGRSAVKASLTSPSRAGRRSCGLMGRS